jgi:hypothetical protein
MKKQDIINSFNQFFKNQHDSEKAIQFPKERREEVFEMS